MLFAISLLINSYLWLTAVPKTFMMLATPPASGEDVLPTATAFGGGYGWFGLGAVR